MRDNLIVFPPPHPEGHAVAKRLSCARLRHRRLAGVLQQAATQDGDILFPLLASMLGAHLDQGDYSDLRIRARLDELQLLVALELTDEGLL